MSNWIAQKTFEAPHISNRANVQAVMRGYARQWERGDLGILDETGAAVQSS
jgi:hypothetical protein